MLMVSPIVSKLVADDIAREAQAVAARMSLVDEARCKDAPARTSTEDGLRRLIGRLRGGRRLTQAPAASNCA